MKKKKKGLIIVLLVFALLLILYFVLRGMNLEGEAKEETKTETVFEEDVKNIAEVSVINGENTYKFNHADDKWKYETDENFPLSESIIENKISSLTSIESTRVITDAENMADYGLESPELEVKIKTTDEKETSLKFGDTNPAVSGCYMTVDKDTKKVYLVDTGIKENLQFELNDLAEKEEIPAITSTTIKNVAVEKEGIIKSLKEDSVSETGWTFTDEMGKSIPADSSMVSTYMNNFSGLSWSGYETYDMSDLSKYGLDNPTKITIDYEEQEVSEEAEESEKEKNEDSEPKMVEKQVVLLLGRQTDDGNYYGMQQDDKCIYKLSSTTVENIVNMTKDSFLSKKVADYSFADMDKVTFVRNGETYQARKETTEKKDKDEEETATETKYFINDKEIDTTEFYDFYSLITAMEWQNSDESLQPQRNSEMTITFEKNEGMKVQVDYYSYDSNFYLVIDSKGNHMLVNKMKVKEMLDSFDEMIANL